MNTSSLVHQIIKSFPQPSLLLKANAPHFTIEVVNEALLAVSQRKSENDLIGKGIFEAFPDNPNDSNATGVINLKTSLLNTIATGKVQEMPPQKYDIAVPHSNQFETRYWQVKNTPILGDNNTVEYIVHTTEDITDKILLEKKHKS